MTYDRDTPPMPENEDYEDERIARQDEDGDRKMREWKENPVAQVMEGTGFAARLEALDRSLPRLGD